MRQRRVALAGASLLIAAAPIVGSAQTIYRCLDARGHVSLQSQPCGPGQSQARVSTYQPVIDSPAAAARLQRIEQEMSERRAAPAGQHRVTWAAGAAAPVDGRCQSARRRRADTLDRVGLRRTYDLLQKLDEMVRLACKP